MPMTQFHAREPELARGVLELKAKLERDPALRERVRNKYRMKNTTGYSLNAFLDFDRAVDIFQHVMVGSEGTLAFIAEAVLNTVPDLPVKYTGLLLFPDLYAAADSIVPLRQAGAKALEIMDRASLRSVEGKTGVPASIRSLPDDAAGLLVEFQSADRSVIAGAGETGRRIASAVSSCASRHDSPMSPPNKRCCGRFGRACFHRSVRYARAGPRSSSRTLRFPSSRWPTRLTV